MNDPIAQQSEPRDETGTHDPSRTGAEMEAGRVRLILFFCLAVFVAGWSANTLLAANDGALEIFIDGLLPIFEWLLRLPEYFIS
ncbi:MAG: hypothetical protein O3A51_09685 [Verrucomicrobia bacterium]|nr:hypothetical protein [Verrucomicrobiota bacterium]